jgi:hypothetical protein
MNISTLTSDLASVIHGTRVLKVPGIYGIINRAARAVLLDVDPKETMRVVTLGQVFNNTFDYSLPVDVKGDRIVDIRPQADRKPGDVFFQNYSQSFDTDKARSFSNRISTQWNTGVKTIRIDAPALTSPTTITDTSDETLWTATSGATALELDKSNYVAGGGALKFNLSAGSATGYVDTSSLTALDLSDHANVSTMFLWVYLPTGASISSISLRVGSDLTANYYEGSVTANQQGLAFQNGWNLLSFTWSSMTKTGTPIDTAIDSVRVTFAYNSALQTGVKICNLTSALGFFFEMVYYSKYLFRNSSTNAFQEEVTDTDVDALINLDTESYNLLFAKVAYYVAQSLQGADAEYDATIWEKEYRAALKKYQGQNQSETMKKAEPYYTIQKKGYRKYNTNYFNR